MGDRPKGPRAGAARPRLSRVRTAAGRARARSPPSQTRRSTSRSRRSEPKVCTGSDARGLPVRCQTAEIDVYWPWPATKFGNPAPPFFANPSFEREYDRVCRLQFRRGSMKFLLGWISPRSGEVHPRAARAAGLGVLLSVAVAGSAAHAQTGGSTVQNPTVTFSTPGTKTVTLKACNIVGCRP